MTSLIPGRNNIGYYAGDTLTIPHDFFDENDAEINVSGWTWTALLCACNGTILYTLTSGSGLVVSGNTVTLTLTSTQSENADLAGGSYALRAVSGGATRTYIVGKFLKTEI
jgi:hypothetical protein